MNHDTDSITHLQTRLGDIADRLVALGSVAETHRMTELARALHDIAPGTAAALVDPTGSEISRLRAFAVAGRAVMRLSDEDRARLLDRLDGAAVLVAA